MTCHLGTCAVISANPAVWRKWVVVGAVRGEPLSAVNSLFYGKIQGICLALGSAVGLRHS